MAQHLAMAQSRDIALMSNKDPTIESCPTRYVAVQQVLIQDVGNYENVYLAVRQKPKLARYNGVGYEHFARADV